MSPTKHPLKFQQGPNTPQGSVQSAWYQHSGLKHTRRSPYNLYQNQHIPGAIQHHTFRILKNMSTNCSHTPWDYFAPLEPTKCHKQQICFWSDSQDFMIVNVDLFNLRPVKTQITTINPPELGISTCSPKRRMFVHKLNGHQ